MILLTSFMIYNISFCRIFGSFVILYFVSQRHNIKMDLLKKQQIDEVKQIFGSITNHSLFDCKDVCGIIWSYMLQSKFRYAKSCRINSYEGFIISKVQLLSNNLLVFAQENKQNVQHVYEIELVTKDPEHLLIEDDELHISFESNNSNHFVVGVGKNRIIIASTTPETVFRHYEPFSDWFQDKPVSHIITKQKISAVSIHPTSSICYILTEEGEINYYNSSTGVVFAIHHGKNPLIYHGCMDLDHDEPILVVGSIEGVTVYKEWIVKKPVLLKETLKIDYVSSSLKEILKIDCFNAMKVSVCSELNLIAVLQKQSRSKAVIHFFDLTCGSLVQTMTPTFLPQAMALNKSFLILSENETLMIHVYRVFPSSLVS
jgi:hypothetical protein